MCDYRHVFWTSGGRRGGGRGLQPFRNTIHKCNAYYIHSTLYKHYNLFSCFRFLNINVSFVKSISSQVGTSIKMNCEFKIIADFKEIQTGL